MDSLMARLSGLSHAWKSAGGSVRRRRAVLQSASFATPSVSNFSASPLRLHTAVCSDRDSASESAAMLRHGTLQFSRRHLQALLLAPDPTRGRSKRPKSPTVKAAGIPIGGKTRVNSEDPHGQSEVM